MNVTDGVLNSYKQYNTVFFGEAAQIYLSSIKWNFINNSRLKRQLRGDVE